jgi:hypothetical protein
MSVLIKGMEMPKNCYKCRFYYPTAGETNEGKICAVVMCSAANQGTSEAEYDGNRPHWCPLVPLPPHGRLIDADALKAMCIAATKDAKPDFIRNEDWLKACAVTTAFCRDIDEAPTILPTDKEGGGEDG